jgi:hypothetical protein
LKGSNKSTSYAKAKTKVFATAEYKLAQMQKNTTLVIVTTQPMTTAITKIAGVGWQAQRYL